MKLTFIGAAHEVTGSCTLLDCCGGNFLIDYGMEQGVNVFENVPLPVLPGQIDVVFLTHAHIDHSGMLPKLYKDGFRGKVYATRASENLCRIMLMDSANIQVSDAEWMNRRAARAGRTAVDPVYTTEDAAGVLRLLRPCSYAERIKAAEGVEGRFTDVGHLLGAACVELWLTEGGETRKIVFSGDVGNTGLPLVGAPLTVDEADYLVIEAIILFAGYQAEGTLGRSLLNGAKTVRLFGEEISVSAEICALHGTSGHADRDGLLKWVQAIKRKPRVVFVNHGDEENCEAFRDRLVSEGYCAVAPFSGTEFDLLHGKFLMVTEGQRIEKKGRARKKEVFAQLVEAAQRLVAVAMACKEQSNQRLRRFTSEIELLIDTWKD